MANKNLPANRTNEHEVIEIEAVCFAAIGVIHGGNLKPTAAKPMHRPVHGAKKLPETADSRLLIV